MSSPILIVKALTFLSGFGGGMCSCKHSYAWNADACDSVTVLYGANQGCFVHCCYRAFTKSLIGVAHWNTGDSCSPYRSKILFSNRSLCLNKFLKLQFCFQITTWYKHFLQFLRIRYGWECLHFIYTEVNPMETWHIIPKNSNMHRNSSAERMT